MKTKSIIVVAVSVVAVGTVVYLFRKKVTTNRLNTMLDDVADEGYETAQDILYPQNSYRRRGGSYLPA